MTKMSNHIVVLDYGMGNLHSVEKALHSVSPRDKVSVGADLKLISSADRIVFPGVGAMRDCMAEIKRLGLDTAVTDAIRSKPVLAICVGMQALMIHSDENGGVDCLGLLPGEVKLFDSESSNGGSVKVPHMGWNSVIQTQSHAMWEGIDQGTRFYFVHSYFVKTEESALIAASCRHGCEFTAAISRENVFGVQFHPEKSANAGLRLLKNFVDWKV